MPWPERDAFIRRHMKKAVTTTAARTGIPTPSPTPRAVVFKEPELVSDADAVAVARMDAEAVVGVEDCPGTKANVEVRLDGKLPDEAVRLVADAALLVAEA